VGWYPGETFSGRTCGHWPPKPDGTNLKRTIPSILAARAHLARTEKISLGYPALSIQATLKKFRWDTPRYNSGVPEKIFKEYPPSLYIPPVGDGLPSQPHRARGYPQVQPIGSAILYKSGNLLSQVVASKKSNMRIYYISP